MEHDGYLVLRIIRSNNSVLEKDASEYLTYQIGEGLQVVYVPIISLLGIAFNVLSLAVLLRKHNRQNPFCVFVAGLAAWDIVQLVAVVSGWSLTVPIPAMTELDCHILTFVGQIATGTTTFLLVAITADRCLLVSFSGQVFSWRTPAFSSGVIFMTFLIGVLAAVPSALSANKINSVTCASWANNHSEEYPLILVFSFGFVPCVAIFLMNLNIVRILKKAGRIRRVSTMHGREDISQYIYNHSDSCSNISTISMEDDDNIFAVETPSTQFNRSTIPCCCPTQSPSTATINHRYPTTRPERTQAILLLTMSFTFLLLRLPQYIIYVVYTYINLRQTPAIYAAYILVHNVVKNMYITDCAINAMVVCAVSSTFRNDLFWVLHCCKDPIQLANQRTQRRPSRSVDTHF